MVNPRSQLEPLRNDVEDKLLSRCEGVSKKLHPESGQQHPMGGDPRLNEKGKQGGE